MKNKEIIETATSTKHASRRTRSSKTHVYRNASWRKQPHARNNHMHTTATVMPSTVHKNTGSAMPHHEMWRCNAPNASLDCATSHKTKTRVTYNIIVPMLQQVRSWPMCTWGWCDRAIMPNDVHGRVKFQKQMKYLFAFAWCSSDCLVCFWVFCPKHKWIRVQESSISVAFEIGTEECYYMGSDYRVQRIRVSDCSRIAPGLLPD